MMVIMIITIMIANSDTKSNNINKSLFIGLFKLVKELKV